MDRIILKTNDTIAAIATGLTNSGISIIRISGPDSIKMAGKFFMKKKDGVFVPFDAENEKSHTVHYGFIVRKQPSGEIAAIDEVMLLLLRSPNTFTREDTVEIDCHGGITVTKAVLERVIECGARTAEPGEFTKRAFLNGRIDLSQAEAVAGIINAKNSMALANSIKQLGGVELNRIKELRDKILHDTAYIEAALDDPEHYELDDFSSELLKNAKKWKEDISKMIKSAGNGRLISEGINTVIVGKPNAGKSTLLNAMLGEERAIVTEIAGTTRDTLEESISFDGISLNMIDTAGIRESEDVIEQMGVDRALAAADNADLVLYVMDKNDRPDADDEKIIKRIKDKKLIILFNKSDIDNNGQYDDSSLKQWISDRFKEMTVENTPEFLDISAKYGSGIEELGKIIKKMFFMGEIIPNDEVYITSVRHKECLAEAEKSIESLIASINDGMSEDFFAADMMSAYAMLGQIIGEDTDEDLIDRIFKDFCMGK
ncbi:MAG: tRNA uridine-5-carboxymethylaminomethyl(34) synthesis GTPase MnmE [Lachnospiraceae bacterium]|nr:tRNA uridine-5-carboxymethylaminomethyl(34) synthesis GTPase MnmE [Lachnospiraceae bacterium]